MLTLQEFLNKVREKEENKVKIAKIEIKGIGFIVLKNAAKVIK